MRRMRGEKGRSNDLKKKRFKTVLRSSFTFPALFRPHGIHYGVEVMQSCETLNKVSGPNFLPRFSHANTLTSKSNVCGVTCACEKG